MIDERECSCDLYFRGDVSVLQPLVGYRANLDTVLLSACIKNNAKGTLLELGCGVGTASLLAAYRAPLLQVVGVDNSALYRYLAGQNVLRNHMEARMRIVDVDIMSPTFRADMSSFVCEGSCDYIIMNPPYYLERTTCLPQSPDKKDAFFGQEGDMITWSKAAHSMLKHKGEVYIIQSATRLGEVIASLYNGFGGITILPLQSKVGGPTKRFIVKARKNTKEPSQLLEPAVLHHGEGYTALIHDILEGNGCFSF